MIRRGTEGTSCSPASSPLLRVRDLASAGLSPQKPCRFRGPCSRVLWQGLLWAFASSRGTHLRRQTARCASTRGTKGRSPTRRTEPFRNTGGTRDTRRALFSADRPPAARPRDSLRQRKTTKESLAESASNITESLMGISRMMSQQVQQSEETVQTLANSSRTILEANEEFKSMSGTIQLGRKLITKYNRRELTDKMLIFLALALFLATVLYILKKRLFPFL
ncbi:vesicle transport protein SEC20 [Athene cunicularia]|uniref:vesicle transport protein SEC20 n=1 Tax=Athene cunicularia TaxID=194338 RepID=UPI000EF65C4E|nr:vesicle transport protein SEC20 [Athene cunicularia]